MLWFLKVLFFSNNRYYIFVFKAFLISIPFLICATCVQFFIPSFNPKVEVVAMVITFVFGFCIMVLSHNDDEDSLLSQRLHTVGKIIFFALYIFTLTLGIKLHLSNPHRIGGFDNPLILLTVPIALVAAKIFFDMKIIDFFTDDEQDMEPRDEIF